MPIYEYVCLECRNKFDSFITLTEKEKGLKIECPNCHSKKTVQVFGAFAVGSQNGGGGSMPGCDPGEGPGCC